MTELLYYVDAYQRSFDAAVTAVDASTENVRVALDRTAFYPGGGGQPSDEGWLVAGNQRVAVVKVAKEAGAIWHTARGRFHGCVCRG